jgi:toluene monooxygenase system protein D
MKTSHETLRAGDPRDGTAMTCEFVGPILRPGDWVEVIIEAVRLDNPGREVRVEDRGGYVRIHCRSECLLREETVRRLLGQPFHMRDLEVDLSSFSGHIDYRSDSVRFFYSRKPAVLAGGRRG